MHLFGLIGFPLSHSFSQRFFTEKFEKEGIKDCIYQNFPLSSIEQLTNILTEHPNLKGFNITIPYKEKILPFLNAQTDAVKQIGACNCVKITNSILTGYNTDVKGFEISLQKKLLPKHDKALILGTGGAAKAVAFTLQQLNIPYTFVSRTPDATHNVIGYTQLTNEIINTHTLIVNTTPLGMYPDTNAAPAINYNAISTEHYLFDLTYNPSKTLFLQKGEAQGALIENGHDMLVIQAEESWRIWNDNRL